MLRFTLTVRYPDGTGGRSEYDLVTMQSELGQLARVLGALVVGEVVEVRRIA